MKRFGLFDSSKIHWLLSLTLTSVSAAGCAKSHLQPENVSESSSPWTGKLRAPTDEGQISGIDSRAKEIERNLGVR